MSKERENKKKKNEEEHLPEMFPSLLSNQKTENQINYSYRFSWVVESHVSPDI